MPLPLGTSTQIAVARQAAQGTLASTGTGKLVARKSLNPSLKKDTYTSASIRPSFQRAGVVHGVRKVEGSYSAELVPGAVTSDILSTVLRRDFTAVTALTGLSITIASLGGGLYTLTRGSGDWLAAGGPRRGYNVRLTAGSFNVANSNKNLLVVAVTTTILTVLAVNGVALVAEGPIASATLSVPGKVTYIPTSGHTNNYWTVENYYPEIPTSHRHLDCKFGKVDLSIIGTGISEINFSLMGRDRTESGTQYFVAPTQPSAIDPLQGVNGILVINGAQIVTVTDLKLSIDGQQTMGKPTLGSNVYPDVFNGQLGIDGTFETYFDSVALRDLFKNATTIDLFAVVAANGTATAEFISIYLPRIILNSDDATDDAGPIYKTHSFAASENATITGGAEATSFQVQDSLM